GDVGGVRGDEVAELVEHLGRYSRCDRGARDSGGGLHAKGQVVRRGRRDVEGVRRGGAVGAVEGGEPVPAAHFVDGQVAERGDAVDHRHRGHPAEHAAARVRRDHDRYAGVVACDQVAELIEDLNRERRADGDARDRIRRLLAERQVEQGGGGRNVEAVGRHADEGAVAGDERIALAGIVDGQIVEGGDAVDRGHIGRAAQGGAARVGAEYQDNM